MKTSKFFLSTLFAAAAMGIASVPAEADIYLNFSSGSGAMGGNWNDLTGANGSNVALKDMEGTANVATVTFASANTWSYTSNVTENVLKGYLDDGGSHARVTVSGIDYSLYDVIVISATDSGNKFSPVTINETAYTSNAAGEAVAGSDTWGASQTGTVVLGTNAIILSGLTSKTLAIAGGANANGARGGIAGIQIIDQTGKIWEREITSDTNWKDGTWTYAGGGIEATSWDSIEKTELTANLSGTGTVTIDEGGVSVNQLNITGTGTITLAGAGLTLAGPQNSISVAEDATLNVGVALSSASTISVKNNGRLIFTTAQDLGATSLVLSGSQLAMTTFAGLTTTGTLTLAGGINTFNGALSVGGISVSGGINVFNGSSPVSIGALSGAGTYVIGGSAAITIASVYVTGGQQTFAGQNIVIPQVGTANASDFRQQGGVVNIGTANPEEPTSVTVTNYTGSSNGSVAGVFNVNQYGVFTVTGSKNSATAGFAHSFQIAHWGNTQTVNVNGVLNLSNVSLSVKDGTGIVNIGATGELNLNKGLNPLANSSRANSVQVNLNGGVINIGEGGIATGNVMTLTINSGTFGSLIDSWSSSRAMALGGALTIDTTKKTYTEGASAVVTENGSSVTLSGVLSGAGSLTKTGAGTLTLSAANTYTGGTTVSAGTLNLAVANALATNSAVTVSAGSTLGLSAANALANNTINLSGTLNISASGAIGSASTITLTEGSSVVANVAGSLNGNSLTFAAGTTLVAKTAAALNGSTITLNGGTISLEAVSTTTGTVNLDNGTIQLLGANISTETALFGTSGSGAIDFGTTGGITDFKFTTAVATGTGYILLSGFTNLSSEDLASRLSVSTLTGNPDYRGSTAKNIRIDGTNVLFDIEGGAGQLTWEGNASNIWSCSDLQNWTNANGYSEATDKCFYQGDSVTFDKTASVELGGNVLPLRMTVTGTETVLTLSGGDSNYKITGTSVVEVKDGATLILTSAHDYIGGTTIGENSNLKIEIDGTAMLAGSFAGAGTISQDATAGTLDISGANLTNFTGSIFVDDDDFVTTGATAVAGRTANITGTGTFSTLFTAAYGNVINLGDAFAGMANITGGYFTINTSNIGKGTYSLANGVNTQVTATDVTVSNNIIFNGTTQLHTNGTNVLTLTGALSGAGTLDKRAGGTLNVNGTVNIGGFKNYAGTTVFAQLVNLGLFANDDANSLAAGTVTLTSGANVRSDALTLQGGRLNIGGNLTRVDADGNAVASGFGYIELRNGSSISQTAGTVNAQQLAIHNRNNATTETYTITGGVLNLLRDSASTSTSSALLIGHWGSGTNIAMNISDDGVVNVLNGNVQIGWDSTGTLNISGGELNAHTIVVGAADRQAGTVNLTGGRLNVGAGGISNGGASYTISLNGGVLGAFSNWSSEAAMTLGENGATIDTQTRVVSASGASTAGEGASTIALSGVLSGTGSLTKTGAGTLTLSADNTFTGGVNLEAGTLNAAGANALGTGTLAITNGTANISAAQTISGTTISGGTLNATGANALGTGTLEITDGTVNISASQALSGTTISAGKLVVSDSGALGTGTLALNGGVLQLDSSLSGLGNISFGAGSVSVLGINVSTENAFLTSTGTISSALTTGTTAFNFSTAVVAGTGYVLLAGDFTGFDLAKISINTLEETRQSTIENIRFNDDNTQILFDIAGGAVNLVWTGATDNVWGAVEQENWNNESGEAERFYQGDKVTFNESADVTLGTNVSAISVNITGTGTNVVLTQGEFGITGATTISIAEGASLTLSGANSYTGTTSVAEFGTLHLNMASDSTYVGGNVDGSGVLDFNVANGVSASLGTAVAGTIGDTILVRKSGAGALSIAVDEAFAGTISVEAGKLIWGSETDKLALNANDTRVIEGVLGTTLSVYLPGYATLSGSGNGDTGRMEGITNFYGTLEVRSGLLDASTEERIAFFANVDKIKLNGSGDGSGAGYAGITFKGNSRTITQNIEIDEGFTGVLRVYGSTDYVNHIAGTVTGAGSLMHADGGVIHFDSAVNLAGSFTQNNDASLNTYFNADSSLGSIAGDGGTIHVASGKTLTIGTSNADFSYAGTLAGEGTFRKVGTGMLTFTGTLSGAISVEEGTVASLNLTSGGIANFGAASDQNVGTIGSITLNGGYLGYTGFDKFQTINSENITLQSGFFALGNLDITGLAGGRKSLGINGADVSDSTKFRVLGLTADSYTLNSDGTVTFGATVTKLSNATDLGVNWDASLTQGLTGTAIPDGGRPVVAGTGVTKFATDSVYDKMLDGKLSTVAIVISGGGDSASIYGVHEQGFGSGATLEKDIWLSVEGGKYSAIIGGGHAHWQSDQYTNILGDIRLQVIGDTVVTGTLNGGNEKSGYNAKITGDVAVVVGGNAQVGGHIIGGSTSTHNTDGKIEGSTSVTIKNVQTQNTAPSVYDRTLDEEKTFVAGGSYAAANSASKATITGNTSVLVDLGETASGTFAKVIVGGGLSGYGSGNSANVGGNSSVVINANANVTFSNGIYGGSYVTAGSSTVSGDSSVTINGGNYTGTAGIYAGGYGAGSSVSGNTTLTINGGTFANGITLSAGAANGASVTASKTHTIAVNETYDFTNVVLAGFNALSVAADKILTLGALTNSFSKTGAGTAIFTGNLTGAVSVDEGSATFNAGEGATITASNTISGAGAITVGTGTLLASGGISSENVTISAGATLAYAGNGTLSTAFKGTGTLEFRNTGTVNFTGSTAGSISKTGTGTLVLSTPSTAATAISATAGTISVSNAQALGTGALSLSNTTLDLSVAVKNVGAITLNNATIAVVGSTLSTETALITSTGTLTVSGMNTINISSAITNGTYKILTAANLNGITLGAGQTLFTATYEKPYDPAPTFSFRIDGNTILLEVAGVSNNLIWAETANKSTAAGFTDFSEWTATTLFEFDAGTNVFNTGDVVTLENGKGNGKILLTTDVDMTQLVASSGNFEIASANGSKLAGANGSIVVKNGATLVLGVANAMKGAGEFPTPTDMAGMLAYLEKLNGIVVNQGGTLVVTGEGSLSTGEGNIKVDGDLYLGARDGSLATAVLFGGNEIRGTGTLHVGVAESAEIKLSELIGYKASATATTLSGGTITGALSFEKFGAGTLVLDKSYGYTGQTTISAGTLKLATGVGANPTGGSVVVNANGTLDMNGIASFTTSQIVLNGGKFINSGAAVATGTANTNIALTADSVVGGTGDFGMLTMGGPLDLAGHKLTKEDANTFTLSYVLATAGSLDVKAGTLAFSGYVGAEGVAATVQDGATLKNDSSTLLGSINTVAGSTLNLARGDLNLGFLNTNDVIAGAITGTGDLVKNGTGTLTLSGTVSFSGTYTVKSGILDLTAASRAEDADGAGTLAIAGGTVRMAKLGWGATTNFGANFNSDRVALSNGGVLEVTAAQDTETSARRGFSVNGSGTYRYTGTDKNWLVQNDDNQQISLANASVLTFDVTNAAAEMEVSKSISTGATAGTATTGSVVKTGAGTLIMSNLGYYSGGTTVNAGKLIVTNASALGTGTLLVSSGAEAFVGDLTEDLTAATFSNAVSNNGTFGYSGAGPATLSGALTGAGTFKMTGTGAAELTNADAFAGSYAVDSGAVTLSVKGVFSGTNAISIAAGSKFTISGSGSMAYAGTVTGAGEFHKAGTGTLSLSGATFSNAGGIVLDAGTLASYTTAEGVKLTLKGGTLDTFTLNQTTGGVFLNAPGVINLRGETNFTAGTLTFSTLKNAGVGAYFNVVAGGTVFINSNVIFDFTNGVSGTYVLFTGANSITGWDSLTKDGNLRFSGRQLDSHYSVVFGDGTAATDLAIGTVKMEVQNYTLSWLGGETNTVWDKATATTWENLGNEQNPNPTDQVPFVDGDSVVFKKTATVTLGALMAPASLTVQDGAQVTLNSTATNRLSGTGTVKVTGYSTDTESGTTTGSMLTFGSAHDYTGATTIDEGATLRLNISSADTAMLTSAISGEGTLQIRSTANLTLGTVLPQGITGGIILEKLNTGTLTIDAEQTFTGGVKVTGGTVDATVSSALGTGTVTLNGGALVLSAAAETTNTVGNVIAGSTGTLTISGEGSVVLTSANTYSVATSVTGHAVAQDTQAFGTSAVAIAAGADVTFDLAPTRAVQGEVSNVFSGEGALIKTGTGTLELSAVNTYTGGTTISAGLVSAKNDSALGTGTVAIETGATLKLEGTDTVTDRTLANAISGAGTVQVSSSTATLSGSLNDFSGAIDIENGKKLTVSSASTFNGTLKNSGALEKTGTGTLTLGGNNADFSGAVTISAGELVATKGNALGTGTVTNSAALTYNIDGDETSETTSNTFVGTGTFEKTGSGELIVTGTFGHSGATTIDAGTLTLNTNSDQTLTTAISGTGTLVKDGTGTLTLANNSTINNYTVVNGTLANLTLATDKNLLVEGGTLSGVSSAGTVDRTEDASAHLAGTVSFTGGRINTGDVSQNPSFILDVGATVSVADSVIINLSNVTLPTDTDTTSKSYVVFYVANGTLNGWNSLTNGSLRINGVELSKRVEANFDTNGAISFTNNAYDLTWKGGNGVWDTVTKNWNNDDATEEVDPTYMNFDRVTFDSTAVVTLGGVVAPGKITVSGAETILDIVGNGTNKISGTTALNISGGASLTLNSAHDFTGTTTIDDGTLTLKLAASNGTQFASNIVGSGEGGRVFINTADSGDVVLENVFANGTTISGSIQLVKDGAGTLTLSKAYDFTAGVSVKAGNLEITNLGAVGSGQVGISAGANFGINIASDGTFTNRISGAGSLIKDGAGTLTLDARNSYTGATIINDGKIFVSSIYGIASTSGITFSGENGALELNVNTSLDFSKKISSEATGYGTLVKSGTGTLTLSADNSDFSGKVAVDNGSIIATNANALGTGKATLAAGTLVSYNFSAAGTASTSFSGAGSLATVGSGMLTLSEESDFTGGTTIASGSAITATNASALGTGTVDNSGELIFDIASNGTASNVISGAGTLEKTGAGKLTLTGASTYTGSTKISEGTLAVTSAGALGASSKVNVESGSTLAFELTGTNSYTGKISGDGSVSVSGGKLTLGSNNLFTGGISVSNSELTSGRGAENEGIGSGNATFANSTWKTENGFKSIQGRKITLSGASNMTAGTFTAQTTGTSYLEFNSIGLDTSSGTSTLTFSVSDVSNAGTVRIAGSSGSSINLDGIALEVDVSSSVLSSLRTISFINTASGVAVNGSLASILIGGETTQFIYDTRTGNLTLDPVSPDMNLSYAAMVVMPTEMFNQDVSNIRSRLEQRRFETASAQEWELFAQARSTNVSNGSNKSDSAAFDYSTYGALAGADIRLGETTLVGVAIGYDHGSADIHDGQGTIDMDDYRLSVYGSTTLAERFFVDGGAQFGTASYSIDRRGEFGNNKADVNGWNAGVFATAGTLFTISQEYGIYAAPYVGISYMHSNVDDVDENGTSSTSADSFSADSLRSRLGVNASWLFKLGESSARLGLDVAYSHEFLDDELDVDMKAVGLAGYNETTTLTEKSFTQDMISIGANLDVSLLENTSVFFGYSADIGFNSEVSHNVNAGIRFTF